MAGSSGTDHPSSKQAGGPDADRSVGELVFDVSERVSILVREEIELAKKEISEKVSELIKGSVVGIAAGVFVLASLFALLFAIGWLINDLLGIESAVWIGFLIEALLFLVLAGTAGLIAYRAVRKGAPPKPEMAIEEAKTTKETLGSGS